MGETIRAFTAIEIDGEAVARLDEVQSELRRLPGDVKWVRPENLHLTLHFLGNVLEDRVPDLEAAIARALEPCPPFTFRLEGIGSFPPRGAPRVVWAGVSAGVEELSRLYRRVSAELQAFGYEPETRPYHPHVTLGRVRSARDTAELRHRIARGVGAEAYMQPVKAVVLKRSRLTPSGAIYDTLLDIPLREPPDSHG